MHPFREGNGRTQRAFIGQLAADLGYRIPWGYIDPQRNVEASRAAHWGDERPLRELLSDAMSSVSFLALEHHQRYEHSRERYDEIVEQDRDEDDDLSL